MAIEIKAPTFPESVADGTVATWHKKPGEAVKRDELIVDIETGGHVFQLHATNSTGMFERAYITETVGQWSEGDIHFGFNISRVFTLHDPKAKARERIREQEQGEG